MTSTPKESKPTPEPLSSKTLYLRWMGAVVLVALIAGLAWYRDYHTSYGVMIVRVNHTDDPIGLYVNGNWGGVLPHTVAVQAVFAA